MSAPSSRRDTAEPAPRPGWTPAAGLDHLALYPAQGHGCTCGGAQAARFARCGVCRSVFTSCGTCGVDVCTASRACCAPPWER